MAVPWYLIGGAGMALLVIALFYFVIVRSGR